MRTETTSSRRAATAIAIALAMSVSACAHVSQDQFDAEIASLRSQMEQGDEANRRGVDESTLREVDLPVLDHFGSVVSEYYPNALLTVEGFTDPAGSVEYNRQLGLSRAEAVRTYLVESGGFVTGRVRAVSYGEDEGRLVAPGKAGHEAGWENRRVAFVVEHLGTPSDDAPVTGGTR